MAAVAEAAVVEAVAPGNRATLVDPSIVLCLKLRERGAEPGPPSCFMSETSCSPFPFNVYEVEVPRFLRGSRFFPSPESPMSPHRLSLVLSLALAVLIATHAPASPGDRGGMAGGISRSVPPPNAAAKILPNAGSCIQFISVFVPSHGGHYVVGISFASRDLNGDGAYTPGVDKMDVCVNCDDACDFGP